MTTPGSPGVGTTADNGGVARLNVALRIGALLLGSGASTDEVEATMRRLALAYGLREAQAIVTLGTIILSAVVAPDQPPVTSIRLVRARAYDYARLADAAELADRIAREHVDAAAAEPNLLALERARRPTRRLTMLAASGATAAASSVLFGGSTLDAIVTFAIAVLISPVVDMLEGSRLPPFFQTLTAPFLATLLGIVVVAVGVPVNGGLVITGGILRFLPTAGLVAGMRDLIDQSIISGSARLAEALLLASAVGIGTALAIQVGVALGGPRLRLGELGAGPDSAAVEVVAAALVGSFFAYRYGVRARLLPSVFLVGALAWIASVAAGVAAETALLPTAAAAITVGAVGQAFANRQRLPSVIWTVPALLPLLPGLAMVDGILRISTIEGVVTLVGAVATGFALGAGVAFGGILVATAVQVREGFLEPIVLEPVTAAITSGIGRVTRSRPTEGADEERPGAG